MKTTVNDPRLRDAPQDELEISYIFLQTEEDNFFYRWERMLGLVWTPEDLEMLKQQDAQSKTIDGNKELEAPSSGLLRYPLSLLIRPELLKSLQEHAVPAAGGLFGMNHVPSDALSLSKASRDQFLTKMGAQSASDLSDDFEATGADPFGPSRRPEQKGFSEGKSRPIGGGNRR